MSGPDGGTAALYQEDLDAIEQQPAIHVAGQPEPDSHPIYMVPECHPKGGNTVGYTHGSGLLVTQCATCGNLTGVFALAQRRRIVS